MHRVAGITYMARPVVTCRDLFGYPFAAITAIDHVNPVTAMWLLSYWTLTWIGGANPDENRCARSSPNAGLFFPPESVPAWSWRPEGYRCTPAPMLDQGESSVPLSPRVPPVVQ